MANPFNNLADIWNQDDSRFSFEDNARNVDYDIVLEHGKWFAYKNGTCMYGYGWMMYGSALKQVIEDYISIVNNWGKHERIYLDSE